MRELLAMLEHRIPNIRQTDTWQKHAWRWARNWIELQNLRNRRPELYEKATVALVNHIANRANRELEGDLSFNEDIRHSKPPVRRTPRE